jgi:hypothetical protein
VKASCCPACSSYPTSALARAGLWRLSLLNSTCSSHTGRLTLCDTTHPVLRARGLPAYTSNTVSYECISWQLNHYSFQKGQRNHCPAVNGPAQVSWHQLLKSQPCLLKTTLLLELIDMTKPAPRRALPTACELVRQRPLRAMTAAQSTI